MRSYQIILVLLAGATCCLAAEAALAQASGPSFSNNRNQFNLGRSSFRHNTNYLRQSLSRPTVSPYLNLLREDGNGLPTYHTTVRPALEQRSTNRQQALAIRRVQNQFNAVFAAQQSSRGRRIGIRSTGHSTQFMNYSHYYPALGRR